MNTVKTYNPFFFILLITFLISACSTKTADEHTHDEYTCPMHPTVLSDKPGSCPVCGMDLVLKGKAGSEIEVTPALTKLIVSPNESITSSIRTIQAEQKSLSTEVDAQGVVTYDTRYVYSIPARIGGRLEKVYLKYAFQPVTKGQKVAEIYSPELLTAQRELLYLVESDPDNTNLIEGAKNKLYLLGASVQQVNSIIKSKEAVYTFGIYSPYNGYIISENQSTPVTSASTPSAASSMGGGMGSSSAPGTTGSSSTRTSSEFVREGNYVSTGQALFKVVDTHALRVELDLPGSQANAIKLKDEVMLDFDNGTQEKAKIDFIQPFFTEGQDFVKVRAYIVSDQMLHIGQLVRATIHLNSHEGLWLPKESILDMGLDKIVFVKVNGVFSAKKITTGIQSGSWTEVKQGISASDEIASNAQYLVDSESFIKIK